MRRLAGRTLFTVGKRSYRWEDVLLAAHLSGRLAEAERQAREGLACQKQLDATDREAPEREIDEATEEWRYERDLLSADDTQSWMTEHRLEEDEWLDYVRRSVLRLRTPTELAKVVKAHPVAAKEVDRIMYAELVCSGLLASLAERLAGQAAIYERLLGEKTRPPCSKANLRPILKSLPRAVKEKGVLKLGPAAVVGQAEFIACLMLSFDWFIDRLAAPASLEREIEDHALEWTRLDCEIVTFDAEETAREAALLVRSDGLPLTKVAAIAKSPVADTQYVLEDVETALKDRLVGAQPGEFIGPVPDNGSFVLVSVRQRVEPSLKDVTIRRRAQGRVVARTIQREVEKRVRWRERI